MKNFIAKINEILVDNDNSVFNTNATLKAVFQRKVPQSLKDARFLIKFFQM